MAHLHHSTPLWYGRLHLLWQPRHDKSQNPVRRRCYVRLLATIDVSRMQSRCFSMASQVILHQAKQGLACILHLPKHTFFTMSTGEFQCILITQQCFYAAHRLLVRKVSDKIHFGHHDRNPEGSS